jgi:hypothetical protein
LEGEVFVKFLWTTPKEQSAARTVSVGRARVRDCKESVTV